MTSAGGGVRAEWTTLRTMARLPSAGKAASKIARRCSLLVPLTRGYCLGGFKRRVDSPQKLFRVALAAGWSRPRPCAHKGLLAILTWSATSHHRVESPHIVNSLCGIEWTGDYNVTNNGLAITSSPAAPPLQRIQRFRGANRIGADNSRQICSTAHHSSSGHPGGRIFLYSRRDHGRVEARSMSVRVLSAAVAATARQFSAATRSPSARPEYACVDVTATGSQINAYGSGSYVALVAPQIIHSGVIRTDTAAALVAAEAATITFSPDGLYNVQVTNGTDAATGIDVDGGTITRNSAVEGTGNRRAYLVAVARNDAVAMLWRNGGSVGFDTPHRRRSRTMSSSCRRYDVNGHPQHPVRHIDRRPDHRQRHLLLRHVRVGQRRRDHHHLDRIDLVRQNSTFTPATTASSGRSTGNTLSFGGRVFASVNNFGTGPQTNGNLLRFGANANSALTVGGNVFLSAQSFGAGASVGGTNAGNATGGSVIARPLGSTIDITGNLDINVDGYGAAVTMRSTARRAMAPAASAISWPMAAAAARSRSAARSTCRRSDWAARLANAHPASYRRVRDRRDDPDPGGRRQRQPAQSGQRRHPDRDRPRRCWRCRRRNRQRRHDPVPKQRRGAITIAGI